MVKKILPVVLFLCLLSSGAFGQNTAEVTVQVTDTEVIATFTGFIPSQGGACCSYFRCYQDSNAVGEQLGEGSHYLQWVRPKGEYTQGNHVFRVDIFTPVSPDISDSETITIDNTPQMTMNPIGDASHPFDMTGTAQFVSNGASTEGALSLNQYPHCLRIYNRWARSSEP